MAETLQELCALFGGHQPDAKDPSKCRTCGVKLKTGARVAFLPLTKDLPEVCGACGRKGQDPFLGEVFWARVDLTGPDVEGGRFQAVLYVPLHAQLCSDEAGVRTALGRLNALMLTHTVTVCAVVPGAGGGSHE